MAQEEREQQRSVHLYDQVQDVLTRERQEQLRRRTVWLRVLLPVVLIVLLVLGGLAFMTWRGVTMNRFRSDVELHLMTVCSDWPLQAEYQGEKTLVAGKNLGRIYWALTLSQMKLCLLEPQTDAAEEIRLSLPSGAVYTIAPELRDPNVAVIRYQFESDRRTLSIRGFAVQDWLKRAISKEGIEKPNRVVEEFPVVYGEEEKVLPGSVETGAGSDTAETKST
ncbi:MAG: hypothetical protein QM296_05215 [Bacillota bacterium]|nr:hypothetical protein [Bacillota bacterium]